MLVEFPEAVVSEMCGKPQPLSKAVGVVDSGMETVEKMQGLVGCLSAARATGYETWRDVAFALKSALALGGSSDGDLLKLFDEFSRKAKNYDADKVLKMWEDARPEGGITVGSLRYWHAKTVMMTQQHTSKRIMGCRRRTVK